MASPLAATLAALLLALVLSLFDASTCQLLRGSVSCLDCDLNDDLSGVRVSVNCSNEKSQGIAMTNKTGHFEAAIPPNSTLITSSQPPGCLAALLGGPMQLYSFMKSMVSDVVASQGSNASYALSTPLTFFSSCPSPSNDSVCTNSLELGQSKQAEGEPSRSRPAGAAPPPSSLPAEGLPLLTNWSLPIPLIDFFPFFPIIGIP